MRLRFRIVALILSLAALPNGAWSADTRKLHVTHGPANHFFGYIGHVGNTPWNKSGRYMVVLRTTFQERMPGPNDPADIVLLDTEDDYKATKIEETRAWNPQQGTMLYWNPDAQETQFFFNDRDAETQKVFCVLYDIEKKKRIKEYRFEETPVGNGGIAQNGGYFLGLNYGRMDALRRVTGYGGAYDWTGESPGPESDGIHKINIKTGEKEVLVSFAALANYMRPTRPEIDDIRLFINHSLWSREGERILFYLRGNWNLKGPRVNELFTIHADGTNLTRHETFLGGHPEWGPDNKIIGTVDKRQVIYDPDTQKIVKELGNQRIFPDAEGDIALSPDGHLFVNGYKVEDENHYAIYNMETGKHITITGTKRGQYRRGDLRLDPSPCWRPDGKAIAVPGLAPDGTRQTFVIKFNPTDLH